MSNDKQFWSAQEIADEQKAQLSQILYAIVKLGSDFECSTIIANRRVYSAEKVNQIVDSFNQIQDSKNVDN